METLNAIFVDPIFNVLIALYNVLGDLGVAIIVLTLIVRLILAPLASKAFKAQRRLQAVQPQLKKLQEKHKDDREKLAQELMAFYKREGVNPASSCLPTLLQIPILIALFFVFKDAVTGHNFESLYSFVQQPGKIDPTFLGLIDLSTTGVHPANVILAAVTGGMQFIQSRMLMPKNGGPTQPGQQLIYLFPVLTFVFALTLPAALPLYWASSTAFMIAQQYWIARRMPLAVAQTEAVADWNQANPDDSIKALKSGKGAKSTKPAGKSPKRSKGSQVVVRKRGE